jgi:hypothetical protein
MRASVVTARSTGYFSYYANHGVTEAAGVNGNGYYSFELGTALS